MDKSFWISIKNNDFEIPVGYSVFTLTDELFSYIGSTDAELRDTIGLEAFYHWLIKGHYNAGDLRSLTPKLLLNLQKGIGEVDGDFVFLRSFSALWLAIIIDHTNETSYLDRKDVAPVIEAALEYFTAENDLRCYIPGKGFAHALAHASDLLGALGNCRLTEAQDHKNILDCIAKKLEHSTGDIYLYNEDSRLARAVTRIFARNTLNMNQINDWLTSLRNKWDGAWQNKELARAYNNSRNFLRSLYMQNIMLKDEKIPNKERILELLEDTFNQAKPWVWTATE